MNKILKYSLVIGLFFFLQSCFVAQKYQRPIDEGSISSLFEPEYQQNDISNMADIKWDQFFDDPILQNHIQTALDSNFDFAIAFENIKSANAYFLQSKQAFLPDVHVGIGGNYTSQSLNTQFGQFFGDRLHIFQYDITGSLSWEADIWGKLSSAKRASYAELQNSVAARQTLQTTLISTMVSLYYQLLLLDEQKKVTEQTIASRNEYIETSRSLKESGLVSEVAVKQSEALSLNAQALLINLQNQIKITENTFSLLLGKSPMAVRRSTFEQQQISTTLAIGVPYQLLNNRPDVRAAEYHLIRAFELTNVAKANFYPQLNITATGGLRSMDIDRLFDPKALFVNAIGSLTQPIWNKRRLKTQHEVSLANQEAAYLNYKKAIVTAAKEISDALSVYESQSQIELLKIKENEAYKDATSYSQELVNNGLANYLEVLRAQENELITQLSLLTARYEKLNAVVSLYKALGGGSE